jgi:hypothetical protein
VTLHRQQPKQSLEPTASRRDALSRARTHARHIVEPASRVFAWLWARIHALQPSLLGGCRALDLLSFLSRTQWEVRHHARMAPLGIAVEAVVAQRK